MIDDVDSDRPTAGEPRRGDPLGSARLRVFATAAGACVVALVALRLTPQHGLTELFFHEQDLPVVLPAYALLFALPWLARAPGALALAAWIQARPRATCGVAAVLVAMTAAVGVYLVCRDHPLSVDEFMATFDAAILRRGALIARVPQAWRRFTPALQPIYALDVANGSAWSSSYFPINAAARAALSLVGLDKAAGALWAAAAVLLTFGLARRLAPGSRGAPIVAVVLLASSSQFLTMAMTPYAMSAHLALNLLWLTLFLRRGVLFQALALGVAFCACGLHQLAFHPLFAAPFVVQLWTARRWRPALFHTLGYAAIALFWASYWRLALATVDLAPTASRERGPHYLVDTLVKLIGSDPRVLLWSAENLVRLLAWQNPLTLVLAVAGAPAAWRAGGTPRALLAGAGLTLVVVVILQPYQGHGWGYRYAHGLLGGLALIGALGWAALWDRQPRAERLRGLAQVIVAGLAALLVLFPIHALQVRAFIAPYARAEAAIRRQNADVVLVDDEGSLFADDLVRNDPWLRARPKVLAATAMTPAMVDEVCRVFRVVVFDRVAARAAGLRPVASRRRTSNLRLQSLLAAGRCGARISVKEF